MFSLLKLLAIGLSVHGQLAGSCNFLLSPFEMQSLFLAAVVFASEHEVGVYKEGILVRRGAQLKKPSLSKKHVSAWKESLNILDSSVRRENHTQRLL